MRISDWAAALLCCAALVAVWPATGRSRWRTVLGGGGRTRDGAAGHGATGRSGLPAVTPRPGGLARPAALLTAWLGGSPHRLTLLSCVVGGVAGAAIAGPVAGTVAATYGGLAAHLALGRRAARAAARERRHRLDRLGAMAADLRAGLPPPGPGSIVAVPGTRLPDGASDPAVNGDGIGNGDGDGDGDGDGIGEGDGDGNGRIGSLVRAAARLAERTGAPLADLLDRIEADARATDRGLAAAEAQAAGARATAWLLAVLPVGGIALGYAIGVDPLAVLLHTPIGAGCAIAALLLQLGGLAWSNRLSATAGRVP